MHILTKKILLDMLSLYTQEKVHVKKGDTAIRLSFHLSEHGKPYEIKNGKAVFVGQKPNGKLVEEKCNVRGNVVEFDLTKDTTDITGVVDCELELYTDDGLSLTSPRFAMVVDGTLRSSNTGNDIPDNPDTPADPDDPAEDPVIGVEASVDEDGVLTMRSLIDNTHAIEASIWADESYIDKEAPIGEAYVDYPAQNEVKKSLASMFYTDSPADGTKLYIKVKAYADRAESDAVPEVVIETIWQSAWASPDSTECTHNWSEATCTAPKTCVLCGATEGEALGHEWAAATCDKPKTCTRCGKTEGNTLGHDYVDGVCTRCGAADDPYDPDAGVKLSIDEYGILTMQYKREHHARWYSVYCFTAANYSSGGTPVFYLECVSPSGGLEYDGATLNLAETFAAYTDLPADGEVYYLRVTADDEYTNPAAEFRFVWDSKWNEGLSEKITASVDASGVLTMHSTLEGVRWYDVHIRYESGDDSAPKASAHHVGEGVLDRDGDNRAEIYLTSIFDDYGESYPEDAQPIYVRVYADDENMYPVREFQFVWDSNWNDSGSAASVAASVDAFGTLEMSTSLDYIRWYDVWIWDKAAGGDFIAYKHCIQPDSQYNGFATSVSLKSIFDENGDDYPTNGTALLIRVEADDEIHDPIVDIEIGWYSSWVGGSSGGSGDVVATLTDIDLVQTQTGSFLEVGQAYYANDTYFVAVLGTGADCPAPPMDTVIMTDGNKGIVQWGGDGWYVYWDNATFGDRTVTFRKAETNGDGGDTGGDITQYYCPYCGYPETEGGTCTNPDCVRNGGNGGGGNSNGDAYTTLRVTGGEFGTEFTDTTPPLVYGDRYRIEDTPFVASDGIEAGNYVAPPSGTTFTGTDGNEYYISNDPSAWYIYPQTPNGFTVGLLVRIYKDGDGSGSGGDSGDSGSDVTTYYCQRCGWAEAEGGQCTNPDCVRNSVSGGDTAIYYCEKCGTPYGSEGDANDCCSDRVVVETSYCYACGGREYEGGTCPNPDCSRNN